MERLKAQTSNVLEVCLIEGTGAGMLIALASRSLFCDMREVEASKYKGETMKEQVFMYVQVGVVLYW
jgi:hypothetical protein